MSIHNSFKSSDTMKRHRSVFSRLERVKLLGSEGELDLNADSFFGLRKVKHTKLKTKKGKSAAKAADEAVAAGAGGAKAAAGAGGAKAAAGAGGAKAAAGAGGAKAAAGAGGAKAAAKK